MILSALVYSFLISMTFVLLGVSKPWDMEFKKLVENISDPTLYAEVVEGEDNSSNKDVVAKNTHWKWVQCKYGKVEKKKCFSIL